MSVHKVTHYLYSLNGKAAADITQEEFEGQMALYSVSRNWFLIPGSSRMGDLQGVPAWICEFEADDHKEEPPKLTVRPHAHRGARKSYDPTEELIETIDGGEETS